MDLMRFLLRMSQWARNPPPAWKVLTAASVLGIGLLLYVLEEALGWPDWLTVNEAIKAPFLW